MNPYLFLWHCPLKDLYKSFKKWPLTPGSLEWLCAVWYCAESISKNLNISVKTKPNLKIFQPITQWPRQTRIMKNTVRKSCLTVLLKRILKSHLTQRCIILGGTWLRAVWYCVYLDSAQYNTAQNFGKIRLSRRKWN